MRIREASPGDLDTIIQLIRGLADYERAPEAVVLDRGELARHLFGAPPAAHVLLLESSPGEVAGFALWYQSFSTWLGRPGLFLEDLFVWPEHRGRGFGKALLVALAAIALERGYGRMEWDVLDWNTPAQEFYRALGAGPTDEWTRWRLAGTSLTALAARMEE